MASSTTTTGKLYFGYGSNLSVSQMHARCPNSHYVGLARLKGYKWIINDRGYANVVKPAIVRPTHSVWGLVFYLTPEDEERLDMNEGVPYAYTKETHKVDFWRHELEEGKVQIDVENVKAVKKEVLVYIDRKRVEDNRPKAEYVVRMNRGIEDAVRFGVPQTYVDEVMRKFIPAPTGKVDEEVVRMAAKQALEFRDEDDEELDGFRGR